MEVVFLARKLKVAPIQQMSIPRLELQAAVLGTRLARQIQEDHDLEFERRIFWSDSKTVLTWITSWKSTFILTTEWRYVDTKWTDRI